MAGFLQFALLGLGVGALYSLASQGLMVIYRGSGVLNFAQGAMGMVGAYVAWEVRTKHGQPFWLALLVGVLASALLGALTHILVMRQLRRASPLARIVATLGVLILLQGIAVIRYGARVTFVESGAPDDARAPVRQGGVDRPLHPARHRRRPQRRAVGAVQVHEVRPVDDGGRREPAGGIHDRALARPHRRPQLVARRRAGRVRGDPGLTDRDAAGLDDDQPRAGGHGRRARRQLPVVPDRVRRRRVDRGRPDAAGEVRRPAGPVELPAVRRDHPGDDLPRARPCRSAATSCRSCPASAPDGSSCGRSPSASRWPSGSRRWCRRTGRTR